MPSADDPVRVWGLPLAPLTFDQALDRIDRLIETGRPSFFITANLHYAMLSAGDTRLRANNDRAALILADGMPIVWASRWRSRPLPERVTGSDLFPALCERAAQRGGKIAGRKNRALRKLKIGGIGACGHQRTGAAIRSDSKCVR